jgi:hypothetical protein
MSTTEPPQISPSPREPKIYAVWLALGALASVALMTHHPTASGSDLAAVVQSLARIAALSAFVHGGMIAALGALAFGFQGALRALGPARPALRAAWLCFASGALFLCGAAVTNGFVVGRLAERYVGTDGATLESLRPILRLCHAVNQSLAELGTCALAMGIAACSLVLLSRGKRGRSLGLAGLALGLLTVLGLTSDLLVLDVHGMGYFVLAQALWLLALAVLLRALSSPGAARGA